MHNDVKQYLFGFSSKGWTKSQNNSLFALFHLVNDVRTFWSVCLIEYVSNSDHKSRNKTTLSKAKKITQVKRKERKSEEKRIGKNKKR